VIFLKAAFTEIGYFSVGVFKTAYIVTCDGADNDGIGTKQSGDVQW